MKTKKKVSDKGKNHFDIYEVDRYRSIQLFI